MEQRRGWTNRQQNFERTAGAAEATVPRERDRQDGSRPLPDDINNIKKKLYDVEGRCQKLEITLNQTREKLKKKNDQINFDEGEIEDLQKKIQAANNAKEDLQKEKEQIEVAIKEADDQIATLKQSLPQMQSLHQTGNREKVLKTETGNKVNQLQELLKEKDKQLCKANVCAQNYKYTLQQLDDTQSALEATKRQCGALEEDLKRKRLERDQHYLRELSKSEYVLRKELSEQEKGFKEDLAKQTERFQRELADREAKLKQQLSGKEEAYKKDLSEQEDRFNKKLTHLEDNIKQQFSVAESYRKGFCEHEERLKKKLDNMNKQLLEKEQSLRKELSDNETKAQLLVVQRNEELQRIREDNLQQELLIAEAKTKKKKGFWKRLFQWKKMNPDASGPSPPH